MLNLRFLLEVEVDDVEGLLGIFEGFFGKENLLVLLCRYKVGFIFYEGNMNLREKERNKKICFGFMVMK